MLPWLLKHTSGSHISIFLTLEDLTGRRFYSPNLHPNAARCLESIACQSPHAPAASPHRFRYVERRVEVHLSEVASEVSPHSHFNIFNGDLEILRRILYVEYVDKSIKSLEINYRPSPLRSVNNLQPQVDFAENKRLHFRDSAVSLLPYEPLNALARDFKTSSRKGQKVGLGKREQVGNTVDTVEIAP